MLPHVNWPFQDIITPVGQTINEGQQSYWKVIDSSKSTIYLFLRVDGKAE